jgi:hypothetical protein
MWPPTCTFARGIVPAVTCIFGGFALMEMA